MTEFSYQNQILHCEKLALSEIAKEFGTPSYVYSRQAISDAYLSYDQAFGDWPHQICYAVKANSNIAVLNVLAKLGAGFDIVSIGELKRVISAGGDPSKSIFSGVGKLDEEIQEALELGIGCFNVESEAELHRIADIALSLEKPAPISLRVNPDVDPQTHPYISTGLQENKFGIPMEDAPRLYAFAQQQPYLDIHGVDCHIGSQLTQVSPLIDALDRVLALIDQLEADGITITHVDLGGGIGIQYKDEQPPSIADYIDQIKTRIGSRKLKVFLEPGRSIVGNAGVLLTQTVFLKPTAAKNFAIVDAAMNDLLRPALYDAWQDVLPVEQLDRETATYDIVGPVCETGDFLAKNRDLALAAGDYLAIMSSGAYGFVMSSNYNSRNKAAEIMVDGDQAHLVRRRETYADQLALERLLPED